jgi:TetR/AcrR family transcriptional repressor of nem operon
MRKSRQETIKVRKRILEAASAEFRSHGIGGTGLTGLMAVVGLTHGAFYRHFESKNEIVKEACELSIDLLLCGLESAMANGSEGSGFESAVACYLSARNRDDVAHSCPYAALGGELARGDDQVRGIATAGLERAVDLLGAQLKNDSKDSARTWALVALSTMVGALTLSRVASSPAFSDEILEAAAQHLIRAF